MRQIFILIILIFSTLTFGQTNSERLQDIQERLDDLEFSQMMKESDRNFEAQMEQLRRLKKNRQSDSYPYTPYQATAKPTCNATWVGTQFIKLTPSDVDWVGVTFNGTSSMAFFPSIMLSTKEEQKKIGVIVRQNRNQLRNICPNIPIESLK